MKDKKTIIGILLIVVIMVSWGIWMRPSAAEQAKAKLKREHIIDSTNKANFEKHIQDSIDIVKANAPDTTLVIKDSTILNLPDSLQQIAVDSILRTQSKDSLGIFAAHGFRKEELITVETEKFLLTFSTKGGLLGRAQMLGRQSYKSRFVANYKDTLDLWVPQESGYSTSILTNNRSVETSLLFFYTTAKSTKIKGTDKTTLSFKVFANNDSSKYLEYVYTISGNDYMIDFDINFVGLEKIIDPNLDELPFYWKMGTQSQEREVAKERESSNIYYSNMEGDVNQLKGGVKGVKNREVKFPLKWVSFKQQFFSAALIPKNGFPGQLYRMSTTRGVKDDRNKLFEAELGMPLTYASKESFKMRMYMGPNHRNTLKAYGIGLAKQIDIGQFFLIEWINLGVIEVFNFFAGMGMNYGIIIIMLTLIIKLLTMPLIYKTFVSSAKMRLLKPDIDELGTKFKPEEAMAKQQAVMQLYRKAGVSPLSGCIPALLQMPILFAMIAFFPVAFELRQADLLWAQDLSTYDAIVSWKQNIPLVSDFYGNHVSLFALLMTITTIFYTKMNSGQMTATGGMQANQMKVMMYLMPVVFLVFLNSYSAALSYYYFLSNLISILLMLFIRKFMIDEKKLHSQIEENKKKTKKKSKWMSRMEDIQKSRQEQLRQQQKGKKK